MSNVYCICMNKGGVGKTTLTTNMAGVLASKNKKVLIIDTDGQGNSAISFGYKPSKFEHSIYDVFIGEKSIDDVKVQVDGFVDLVPANEDMNFLEFDVLPKIKEYSRPFHLLKKEVDKVKDDYDYVLIDTPPSMGLVLFNVLVASNNIMLPFVPEQYNVEGLTRVVDAIRKFKDTHNPELNISGVAGMMIDKRTILHSSMLDKARDYCERNNVHFFQTTIPRSIVFANANAYEIMPAVWNRKGKAIQAYHDLVGELING